MVEDRVMNAVIDPKVFFTQIISRSLTQKYYIVKNFSKIAAK